MMILNLINVIAIAMGIGTSAKSTNLDVEKKVRHNAVQNINETVNFVKIGQDYYTDFDPEGYESTNSKWFLENLTEDQNYVQNNLVITNSTYTFEKTSQYLDKDNPTVFTFLKITNNYSTSMDLMLNTAIFHKNGTHYKEQKVYKTTVEIDSVINLTLNDSTWTTLNNKKVQIYNNSEQLYFIGGNVNTNYGSQTYQTPTGTITLQANETVNLMFMVYMDGTYNTVGPITPVSLKIEATVSSPDINQEIIDVPGLMFTILTLPFSFISQAFDLTIFPNTQYSINFTNLFLTIIAIFILIWLIKHIFK